MKKIITITMIALTITTLTACTKSTTQNTTETNQIVNTTPTPTPQETTQQSTQTPIPTFEPTSDKEVKAMDELVNKVDINEYKEDSLNELN